MTKATPINAIITTICLNAFSRRDECYFSEIKERIEQVVGTVGEGFLASALQRQGYTIDDQTEPWVVRV